MCYFMHIVVDRNISDSIIGKFIDMNIYIRDITKGVEHKHPEKYYYDITTNAPAILSLLTPKEIRLKK